MDFANEKKGLLSIDGVYIETVSEFRLLSVIVDHKLTWIPHIAHVKQRYLRIFLF